MKIIINIIKGILITLFAFMITIGLIGIGIYGLVAILPNASGFYALYLGLLFSFAIVIGLVPSYLIGKYYSMANKNG